MLSQAATIKQINERSREQIRGEYLTLGKYKSASKLIQLIQEYELDPKCETMDQEMTYYLIVAYVLDNDWLALKHLTKRYQLNQVYQGLLELTTAGVNEQLQQFCITLFPKIVIKLKEKSQKFIKLNNFEQLLQKAKINYAIDTYSKYYLNMDIKTVTKTIGCTQGQIIEQGYEIKDGFVVLKTKQILNTTNVQQILMKKMKNLVSVAQNMTALE